jgi:hypothetical protein
VSSCTAADTATLSDCDRLAGRARCNQAFAQALAAALGSLFAAGTALWIASRDREERKGERAVTAKTQAELVVVAVKLTHGRSFGVDVTNFGTSAVLDVTFDSAKFETVPESTYKVSNGSPRVVLDSDRQPHTFWVEFVNDAGESVMPGTFNDVYQEWESGPARPDPSKVTAWVRFRDAQGIRWRRGNSGSAERLTG